MTRAQKFAIALMHVWFWVGFVLAGGFAYAAWYFQNYPVQLASATRCIALSLVGMVFSHLTIRTWEKSSKSSPK